MLRKQGRLYTCTESRIILARYVGAFMIMKKMLQWGKSKTYCANYEMSVKIIKQASSYVHFIHLVLSTSSML